MNEQKPKTRFSEVALLKVLILLIAIFANAYFVWFDIVLAPARMALTVVVAWAVCEAMCLVSNLLRGASNQYSIRWFLLLTAAIGLTTSLFQFSNAQKASIAAIRNIESRIMEDDFYERRIRNDEDWELSPTNFERINGCEELTKLNLCLEETDCGCCFDEFRSDFSDKDAEVLAMQRHLKWIDLTESSISDQSFKYFAKIPRLEHLDLTNNEVDGQGFRDLRKHQSLRKLVLDDCPIKDESLVALRDVPELEVIRLMGETRVSDKGLAALSDVTCLKSLSCDSKFLGGTTFQDFNGCKNLENFYVKVSSSPENNVRTKLDSDSKFVHDIHWNDIPNLRSVIVRVFPTVNLFRLEDLPNLSSFEIFFRGCPHHAPHEPYRCCEFCSKQANEIQFDNVPNLQYLEVGHAKGLSIKDAPNLKHLVLYNCDFFFDQIHTLKNLKQLKIHHPSNLAGEAFQKIQPMPQLESLTLHFEKLNDESLDILKRFPNLKKLSIKDGILTRAGIEKIAELKNLEDLYVHYISDKGSPLEPLSNAKHLKSIVVYLGAMETIRLVDLPKLETLRVDVTVQELHLENLESLKRVAFDGEQSAERVAVLNLPSLHTLINPAKGGRVIETLRLEGVPNLMVLNLCHGVPNSILDETQLSIVGSLTNLHLLDLGNLKLSDKTIAEIDRMSLLQSVSIYGSDTMYDSPATRAMIKKMKERAEDRHEQLNYEYPEELGIE